MTDFRNIPPQNVIAVLEAGTTEDSVSMVEKGNTQYPEISSLVAGDGVTLSKNLDKSVTITSSTPTITHIDLSQPGIIVINDTRGLGAATTFSANSNLLNFITMIEYDTHVEINGSIEFSKTSGDTSGTLPGTQKFFEINLNYDFPDAKSYTGAALVGGAVSHFSTESWIIGSRLITPGINMQQLYFRIGTNTSGALDDDLVDFGIRFSLTYEKP